MAESDRIMYTIPLVILVPILFFPSTVALFAVVRDWILKKNKENSLKRFFHHLKKEYGKSFVAGIIWTVIWGVWVVDFLYFNRVNSVFAFVVLIVGFILFVFTVHFFSLESVKYFV